MLRSLTAAASGQFILILLSLSRLTNRASAVNRGRAVAPGTPEISAPRFVSCKRLLGSRAY